MFVNSINNKNIINIKDNSSKILENKDTNNTFDKMFNSAIKLYKETSNYELEAQKAQLDYITGSTDNILKLTLAEQKASVAVNFTTQITNKIIESYRQVMNMQL